MIASDTAVSMLVRSTLPVDYDSVLSLVEFYGENNPPPFSPLCLAWSLHHSIGADGLPIFECLMLRFEDDDTDNHAAAWADCDRPFDELTDVLLIDEMERVRWHGWTPPAQIVEMLDAMKAAKAAAVRAHPIELSRLRAHAERQLAEIEAAQRRRDYATTDTSTGDREHEYALAEWRGRYDYLWSADELAKAADRLATEKRMFDDWLKGAAAPKAAVPLPEHTNLTVQQAVALEDFYAYLPGHTYIFTPTREMWPASSVNSRIQPVAVPMRPAPITAASWLDSNRAVEQMTWAPGRPMVIEDKLIADGGWFDRRGCRTFNLYRAPSIKPRPGDASPWLNHVNKVFGAEAGHIVRWLAHRVQRPDQKINHALVLGGPQGIGKDTLIEPVKVAVGPWNFSEVSPQQLFGRFNGFVKSVILRVSEARDLGDTDRYGFYEHLKTLTAAPPDVLRVDEKHMREHAVLNVCGVIITTNNKDSLHLPVDDRRHFVAWSALNKEDFAADYWMGLYGWFASGGHEIVAHHLASVDLDDFDAKAPPPKTAAFWEIVDASRAPEDAEMADALDALSRPPAITLAMVLARVHPEFGDWLRDRRNRRKIPHRLEQCGYVPVRNAGADDGYWVVNRRRVPVYALRQLSVRDQMSAAETLARSPTP